MSNYSKRTASANSGYYNYRKDLTRTGRSSTAVKQPLINRITFLIDASSSMIQHQESTVKVIKNQVEYLARRSQEMGQETRVSIASFADAMQWLVYDCDVLRLPTIDGLFAPYGNTALIEAVMRAHNDIAKTPELAGDYAYLMYVLTDGQENVSEDDNGGRSHSSHLSEMIGNQSDNWTFAAFVPDVLAKRSAVDYGFPKDNVAVWDTTSVAGMIEVGESMTRATESYLQGRQQGVRGSRQIFSTGPDAVNKQTVRAALQPLAMDQYSIIPVTPDGVQKGDKVRVDKFIRDDCGMKFQVGKVYYQWMKREKVQPQKQLAVFEKSTGKVYVGSGDEVRQMIGLPNLNVSTAPGLNKDYTIYVQSTAPNRNLVPFTNVLVMK